LTQEKPSLHDEAMFLPYGHQSINEEDIAAVAAALREDRITRGPLVEQFEKAIASYVGAQHAVAFSSGSAALSAAYWAEEIGPQDRVLTSPNTFIATTGFATEKGASVVFVDIDRRSGNFNLEEVEINLNYRSLRGRLFVVPIHFAGIAIDMGKLNRVARASNIVIIEDAAHALGSDYPDGTKVGCCTYSDMTIFSFHPVKNITTGEGGMVTTNDQNLYERLKHYRNSGIVHDRPLLKGSPAPWHYEVQSITGNFHLNEFQAALGLSQLKRLNQFVLKRRELVAHYRKNLADQPFITLFDPCYDLLTAYHLMVVQLDFNALQTTRTELMRALNKEGVGSQLHYIPLYRHPCYLRLIGEIEAYFPEMEAYFSSALSLPLYADLTFHDVDRVCDLLLKILKLSPA
jgi:UDP-4-amino-4,6-dideoxy-L-N-acetyl-beta-L-altrosamine transaminase